MIIISNRVQVSENDIEWQFIRASGAGGQHI
nr:aminoacyl-tRNA hydrolase [Shewanella shenzhenensis]